MKKIFFVWALFVSSLLGQTIGTLPEIISPDVSDVMWLQTATTDYKITLANIYNKLLGRNNEWIGSNTFNGLTNFDSSVVMRGTQSYYSNNYTPGWLGSGFNLDYGKTYANESNLVLDNMTIRGTLSVYELLLRRINATNGNFVVAAAAKINAIGVAPDSTLLFVEDPTGNGLAPFAKDDLVTVRVYNPGSNSIIRETKATVDTVYTYTQPLTFLKFAAVGITYDEGTRPKGGDVLVRMGNRTDSTRMNLIYMSSEDDGAPLVQFKRGIDDWAKVNDESTTILYMGKLDGYNDPDFGALEGDGIVLNNLYAKGNFVLSNQSSIAISGFNNDAGFTDDTQANAAYSLADDAYDLADASYTLAGSKIKTFYQSTAPSTSNPEGSIWFESDQLNTIYRLESGAWVEKVGVGSGFATYIDATGIYTGTVVAENIIGGSFAGKTFTGGIFTGGTFQTAESGGYRIVVNGSGLENIIALYNATGDNYAAIYSDGGAGTTDLNLDAYYIDMNTNTLDLSGTLLVGGDAAITGNLSVTGSYGLTAADIPSLAASKITDGTFDAARIPDLSGAYAAVSHSHAATETTSGVFSTARIPDLSGIYVTNGVLGLHTEDMANPHSVTKAQVGLSSVTNNAQIYSLSVGTSVATYYVASSSGGSPTTAIRLKPLVANGSTVGYVLTD